MGHVYHLLSCRIPKNCQLMTQYFVKGGTRGWNSWHPGSVKTSCNPSEWDHNCHDGHVTAMWWSCNGYGDDNDKIMTFRGTLSKKALALSIIHCYLYAELKYCETQPPAAIGWVALSSVVCRRRLFVPHRWHLLSSPLYDESEHRNHIFSVRIWSWQHVMTSVSTYLLLLSWAQFTVV